MRMLKTKWALASRRAAALVLAMAALSAGGCANSGGDYWKERPSSNYTRLPVR